MKYLFSFYFLLCISSSHASVNKPNHQEFKNAANSIRQTYEAQLFTLPPFKMGHYGLRMYRQTQDSKYNSAIWLDMARIASGLNKFTSEVHSAEQIQTFSTLQSKNYKDSDPVREDLRRQTLQRMPEYLYVGVALLGQMARADEYGLMHKEDAKLREILKRYDFAQYATDSKMIEAWAAQLANQVYWLRQLGEQDIVDQFIKAFKETYPDSKDSRLSDQQYANKIYGLTHIIFAASEYYQHDINEQDFQWIYDYFRSNIDSIITRTKEDVITETAITFLLAGKENDPVVSKARKHILGKVDKNRGMIPSTTGGFNLAYGEHRNVLAVMLLDWQGSSATPNIHNQRAVFKSIPYGLIEKYPSE